MGRFENCPAILPVPAGMERPFWSVMIPTYNSTRYLGETLRSVLGQDLGEGQMQIEVVDNCSTVDVPGEMVKEMGKGRVGLHVHERNIGMVGNFNACVARARGRYVHILHSDDVVLPGFYARMRGLMEACPEAGSGFCHYQAIDGCGRVLHAAPPPVRRPFRAEAGILEGWLEAIAARNYPQFCTMVVKREAYEAVGGFDERLPFCSDWDMWKRLAMCFAVAYVPEMLASYRVHEGSDTSSQMKSAANTENVALGIEIARKYLPAEVGRRASARAAKSYGRAAMRQACELAARGQAEGARAQIRAGMKMCGSPLLWPFVVRAWWAVRGSS